MPAKFTNNASAPLAASINTTSASITVTAGSGALFPGLAAGEYFYATLVNSSNDIEIVKVTARSGDTLTAVRGQEGTTALSWAAADKIELRITAADLANFSQLDAANAFTGNNTFSGAMALPAGPTFGGGALGVLYGGTGATTAAAAAAALAAAFGNLLFPIGSIYTNASSATNPGTLLGFGTWAVFGAGKVPIGDGVTNTVTAGSFTIGIKYTIVSAGTTNFALIGSSSNVVGTVFTATGVGTGTGTASRTWVASDTGGSTDAVVISHNHSVSSISTNTVNLDHSHLYNDTGAYPGGSGSDTSAVVTNLGNNRYTAGMSGNVTHSHTLTGTTDTSGVTGINANLQPYIVVYMWKRTA